MIPAVGPAFQSHKIESKHCFLGIDIQAFTKSIQNMSEICAGAITFLAVSTGYYYYTKHQMHKQDIVRRKNSELRKDYYTQHRMVVESVDIVFKQHSSLKTLMTQYSVFRAWKYWPLDVKLIEYDEETMSKLETFRNQLVTFYKECADNDIYMSAGELYSCVTMHWLVYQTNGICKEKVLDTKYIDTRNFHQKAMLSLERKDPEKACRAKEFQNDYMPMFSTIREAVWS
jgi:hypothetical protein